MTLEETLIEALENRARTLAEPGDAWVEHQQRVRGRNRRRAAIGAGALAACGLLVVTGVTTLSSHRTATPDRLAASPSPSPANVAQGPVVDGVELTDLPPGWAAPGPPHSQDLHPGTRTRWDVVVGQNGEGGGAIVRVYRNSNETMQVASHDVRSGQMDGGTNDLSATTQGDASLGVVTYYDSSRSVVHRTGYRRLSASVFVVVSSSGWSDETVRSVLAGAHPI